MIANVRSILESALYLFSDFGRSRANGDSRGLHRRDLVFRFAAATRNDRSRVTHAPSRRRGLAGDKSNYRLLDVLFNISRGAFFGVSTNFTNHDDRVGVRILVEQPDCVRVSGADHRVASNADAGGLTDSQAR